MRNAVLKTLVAFLGVMALVIGFAASGANAAQGMPGSALIYTYYDVRTQATGGLGVNDNYFTLTNTSSNWVQAHVRVRTGDKSVELLDFDVMLSPKDVFTFTLTAEGTGIAFVSLDKETIAHTKMLAPFLVDLDLDGTTDGILLSTDQTSPFFSANLTSLIQVCQEKTQLEAAVLTRKGYVEVIEEGTVVPCTYNKNKCSGPDNVCDNSITSTDPTIWEYTLSELGGLNATAVPPVPAVCGLSMVEAGPNLHGRVYYATLAPDTLRSLRLAHLDAETIDSYLPGANGLIYHANTFEQERLSSRCNAGFGAELSCYAYNAPSANLLGELNDSGPSCGADDMNYCFYTDSIIAGAGTPALYGVRNKFGAAATFGPTIADLVALRDGSLSTTASALDDFSENASRGYFVEDGTIEGAGAGPKQFVNSHFVFYPGVPFDVVSAWAFIFPVQHFIGEQNKFGNFVFFDLNENTTIPAVSGFISPGLPGPGLVAQEEAFIQTLSSAPYDEGWVIVGPVTATNKTSSTACMPGSQACVATTSTLVRSGTYTPGYTGATFVLGPNNISASLLQVFGPIEFGP
jgi:hypothetical protein